MLWLMKDVEPTSVTRRESAVALLLIVLSVAVLFSGAPSGGAFYWSDAPRHALNGVFVMDLVRAFPIDDPSGYAYRYYAQYPALTILFYPPLFYFLSAPFFWIFGVSHETALWVVALHYVAFGAGCWRLARYWLSPMASLAFAGLMVWMPEVAFWGRQVMLEVPAFAFLIWSSVWLVDYLRTGRPHSLYAGVALLVLAAYTKISVAYLGVAFLFLLALRDRWSMLRNRHHWYALTLGSIALIPLFLLTLKFGQANVQSVTGIADAVASRNSWAGWVWYLKQLPSQAGWPVVVVAFSGLLSAVFQRNTRLHFWWLNFLIGYIFFSAIDLKEARHSVFLLSSVAFFALFGVDKIAAAHLKNALMLLLVLATAGLTILARPVLFVDGYAQVAAEVARLTPSNGTVMFSGYRDGAFIFNMRAREDRPDIHVLRADKLLLGVAVRRELGVEEKDLTEAQIATMLNQQGVHYVVMQPGFWTDLGAMRRFERVLATAQFELVVTVPTPANHRAHESELRVYRNRGPVADRPIRSAIELRIIQKTINTSPN